MIGLAKVKQQISLQVKSFIVNYRRYKKPTNGEKLHTLLYGLPGCGKTQLGRYLAELWAVSGCLPPPLTKTNAQITPSSSSTQSTQNNTTQSTMAKVIERSILQQNLSIRETQLKQTQEKLQQAEQIAKETLTLYNNVRKRVQAKDSTQAGRIQAKFQEIKQKLRQLSGALILPSTEDKSSPNYVLPVIVPQQPGARAVFGNHAPPLGLNSSFNAAQLTHLNQLVKTVHRNIIVPSKSEPLSPPQVLEESTSFTLPTKPTSITKLPIPVENKPPPEVKFGVITRGDLIAKFQGHTTEKVRAIFDQYDGGVIFIDEAYNLCTSENDDFGKEILTEINNYMTASDRVIFIFAGYRYDMENVVMKIQPGLARRFNWTFEIEKYTPDEINQIFQQQLDRTGWNINPDDSQLIRIFFKDHQDDFPHFGGDTERLCRFITEVCYEQHFDSALDDQLTEDGYQSLFQLVDLKSIEIAFEKYLENSVAHQSEKAKLKEHNKFIKTSGLYM